MPSFSGAPERRSRRAGWDGVRVGLAALVVGLCLAGTATAIVRTTARSADADGSASGRVRRVSDPPADGNPVRVRIPAIAVDAEMDGLGLNPDGTLEVPPYERAGWFRDGPRPGEIGPAVIAAHVDTTTGPDVFYRLGSLAVGDIVLVDYPDGTAVELEVKGADRYPKAEFPSDRVYGDTDGPELRLITCGGEFDRRTGSYDENLVVWAAPRSAEASSSV